MLCVFCLNVTHSQLQLQLLLTLAGTEHGDFLRCLLTPYLCRAVDIHEARMTNALCLAQDSLLGGGLCQ